MNMRARCVVALAGLAAVGASAFGQASVNFGFLPAAGQVNYPQALTERQMMVGMTTPLGNLGTNFAIPDTRLQVLNSAATMICNNDDAGADGRGAGSVTPTRGSVVRYGALAADTYTMRVVGFSATDTGNYALTSAVITLGTAGDFSDTEPNSTIADAQSLSIPVNTAKYGFGSITAGDLDYYAINLNAGEILSAMTVPISNVGSATPNFAAVDTRLDVRNAANAIIITNDDAGTGADGWGTALTTPVRGSAIRYQAITATTVYLTVRGFGTTDAGNYVLLASIIPTPASGVLLAAGALLAARRRRA